MSEQKYSQEVPIDRWYTNDPLAQGNGLGLVLHENDDQWVVVNVLRDSPAEYADVKVGDVLVRVDGYELKDGDSLELVQLIRSGMKKDKCELTLCREDEGELGLQVAPRSMVGILDTHGRLNGGFGQLGSCRSCKLCRPTTVGWSSCGLGTPDSISGRRCSGRCMIA